MRPGLKHPAARGRRRHTQLVLALVAYIQINQLLTTTTNNRIGGPSAGGGGSILGCDALRMINLDAPQMALQGDTIRLTCSFSLADERLPPPPSSSAGRGSRRTGKMNRTMGANEVAAFSAMGQPTPRGSRNTRASRSPADDHRQVVSQTQQHPHRSLRSLKDDTDTPTGELLYAIKWYKDEREFYQYVTKNWPHKHALPMAGLNIDVDKSDNQTVVLKSVSLKTTGLFRCEVSTDAPSFVTKSIERKIFIYSLPAEGPVIETSLPRSRPSQLSSYLGDQLELRCLSRESKPNTQLDWIINDTLNLTSRTLIGPNGAPLFRVTNRSFVRLPKFIAPTASTAINSPRSSLGPASAPAPEAASLPAHNDQLTSANQPTVQFHPHITQKQQQQQQSQAHNNETTVSYELIGARGRAIARPLDGSAEASSAGVSINSLDSLDQFLETSVSSLSFSVDTNLAQHLQALGSRGEPSMRMTQKSANRNGGAGASGQANSSRTWSQRILSSFRTKKIIADQRRTANSDGHLNGGSSWQLDIRCVARVLHLSMSDEIKLKVINTTRTTASLKSTGLSIESRRQEKRVQSSSGVAWTIISKPWIQLACHLSWITMQPFWLDRSYAIRSKSLFTG